MQCVVFHIAEDRYALSARSVVEIVPSIPLRRVVGAAEHVLGVFDYRGVVVPVVDLGVYLGHEACRDAYATRILVCDVEQDVAARHDTHNTESLVGVRAERVVRIEAIDPTQAGSHAAPPSAGRPALGRIVNDGEGLLQFVSVRELLAPEVLRTLRQDAASSPESA